MQLVVHPRGVPIKGLPSEIDVSAIDTTAYLYGKIASQTGLSIHRLRITKGSDGSVVPTGNSTIESIGLREDSAISVKDLGPQIAWRTVFLIEYAGPILIHILIYLLPQCRKTPLQKLSCLLITSHFVKREFETIFVHRFSLATMPVRNIFKNSAHYWLLAGLNIAYWIYLPTSSPTAQGGHSDLVTYAAVALFLFSELSNFNTHMVLRNLRRPGTTERGIPHGFGFGIVTCPNYMFETLAWVAVGFVTRSWSVALFTLVAVGQMAVWAAKKERRYRKEFGNQYRKKQFVILPGIY